MKRTLELGEGKIIVICEGGSEIAYMNLLLDNEMLKFSRDNLIMGKLLGNEYRKGKRLAQDYLTMSYDAPITIILVQDDDTNLKIPKPYNEKVENIFKIITAPEIEMLLIHHFGCYKDYKKYTGKPSIYLANHLGKPTKEIKSKQYIEDCFNHDTLRLAIQEYARVSKKRKQVYTLADLLH